MITILGKSVSSVHGFTFPPLVYAFIYFHAAMNVSIFSSLLLSMSVLCVLLVTSARSAPITAAPPATGNTSCEICELVVGVIAVAESSFNASLQQVIIIVNNLCLLIGGGVIGAECGFLTGAINQIIQWLAAELTPVDICQRLHFCNSTAPIPMVSATDSKSLELLSTLLFQKAQFLAQNQ